MAEYTAVPIQEIAANQNVIFSSNNNNCQKFIMHRAGSGIFNLKGPCNNCCTRYKITFGGNIAVPTGGTVGEISMAITLAGEPLLETLRRETPAAVEQYNSIHMTTFVNIPSGCCEQISVQNTSTIPINLQNANLIIERVV